MDARRTPDRHEALSPAGDGVWCGLRQTYLAVSQGLDTELRATHRLALGEFELLRALSHPGCAQRMGGLAEAVGLSPSGLTRAIERLERRGLVYRVACQEDRRGAMAELTVEGTALLQAADVTHAATLHRLLLDRLSAAESAHISRVCQRLFRQEATGCPAPAGGEGDDVSTLPARGGCTDRHDEPDGDNRHT